MSGGTTREPHRLSPLAAALWCVIASFGAYAFMYGLRKPFTAAGFEGPEFDGGDKARLVIAQVLGYTASKFIGIRLVSSLSPRLRAPLLLVLVLLAELALVGFGLFPGRWGPVFLFLNGLPLGIVFGLVLAFVEGRRMTEAFVAGLCISFIVADGAAKSLGAFLLGAGCPTRWMPAVAGALCLPPLAGFVWMLRRIPPPTAADVEERTERGPMQHADRRGWLQRLGTPLLGVSAAYLILTILRSLRADFAPELWLALGFPTKPALFTQSELWVALAVVGASAATAAIRDNRSAFIASIASSIAGLVIAAGATLAFRSSLLGPLPFMILAGTGLYIPYVAVHTALFERLMAFTRERGTIGFPMYVVDAVGYLGYAAVIIARQTIAGSDRNLLTFFQDALLYGGFIAAAAFAATALSALAPRR